MKSSRDLASHLLDLLENAPAVPLLRGQIRVDKREVYRVVDELREALRIEQGGGKVDEPTAFDLLTTADDVREAVYTAHPVPLTDQVRLHRDNAADLARAVRTLRGCDMPGPAPKPREITSSRSWYFGLCAR